MYFISLLIVKLIDNLLNYTQNIEKYKEIYNLLNDE